jgi:hypothetical protein
MGCCSILWDFTGFYGILEDFGILRDFTRFYEGDYAQDFDEGRPYVQWASNDGNWDWD